MVTGTAIDLGGTDVTVNRLLVGATGPGQVGTDITTTEGATTINAGASGTAGTLNVFPSTASKGTFTLTATNNTGNTITTLKNAAMGQATVISIPDPGTSTANVLLDTGVNASSTVTQLHVDSGTKTASATSGAATLNKTAGAVTSESITTAAGSTYTLTLTNSAIAAADQVMVSLANGTNTGGTLSLVSVTPASTSVVIIVKNIGASAFNGTIVISYVVFKN